MVRDEKPEVAVTSSKGQVVIPQSIRKELGIEPKTKLLVYSYKDSVIMKKLEVPNPAEALKEIFENVDDKIARYGELGGGEIEEIIHDYRSRAR